MVNLVMISLMLSAVRRFLTAAFPEQTAVAEDFLYITVCTLSYIALRFTEKFRLYIGYFMYLAWSFVEFTADIVSESKTEKAMILHSVKEARMMYENTGFACKK
ncbi:MAG: hypothetical protein II501_05465 [Clostridia bacterium]|nr:hypothetical protein [Clostridia bacterium]